jgi:Ca2+-binding EF-hand superfamily protein
LDSLSNTIAMSRNSSLSPQTSVTLSVTRDDAHRMLEASRAFNKRILTLQQERDEPNPNESTEQLDSVPQRVVSTSDNGSVATDDSPKTTESSTLVVEAAASCGNALVQLFLASLAGMPSYEIRVCLLLFLDMGKSTKLIKAFRTLAKAESEEAMSMTLTADGAVSLFRCFLTAITLCIQQPTANKKNPSADDDEPPRKAAKEDKKSSPNSKKVEEESTSDSLLPCASPSFDSGMGDHTIELAEETRKEIDEIALFASDLLLDYVKKQKHDETASSITFEEFGSWYNAGGCSIVQWLELLDLSKWDAAGSLTTHSAKKAEVKKSPAPPAQPSAKNEPTVNFFSSGSNGNGEPESRPIVSFDFTGAMSSAGGGTTTQHSPFCINISEENLLMLQNLVYRTGMASRSPQEVCDVLIHHSTNQGGKHRLVLHRSHFPRCIRDLVRPEAYRSFSKAEMEDFSTYFTDFFSCFEHGTDGLGKDQVNVKELAVGFSFLCAGNKSAKLVAGFELLDEECSGHLSIQQLTRYVRSYLTMLVGISLLSANPGENKALASEKRNSMNEAVDNGARWTLGHVQRHFCETGVPDKESVSFEDFANWYTVGGYKVAPWLELLDLSKLLALLDDADINYSKAPVPLSSNRLRQTSRSASKSPSDVLFTFPLANHRSLVVLREDAVYVRSVVEKLALLPLSAEQLWTDLYKSARAQPALLAVGHRKSGTGKCMDVDQATFVRCMAGVMESISTSGRKRASTKSSKISPAARETLMNFFHSYDLEQVDRVSLNELMGGLCLLCGGKKSTKLAFAFGLFDGRTNGKKNKKTETTHSLNGEELFLFLRSFLIIMFSCCQQSMDLSAEQVGRYISDSAHMVVQDVMQYQWNTRKRDRIDFDEFGEWYNEGGFETAPWLELLDLVKWVLAGDLDAVQSHVAPQKPVMPASNGRHVKSERPSAPWTESGNDCPPPPPEDALDASLFADDGHELMQMDSIDEMDIMLMQAPSQDKENGGNRTSLPLMSPNSRVPHQSNARPDNSFKFHLITYEEHGGYRLSVSQRRVSHLGHILTECGLYQIDAEEASRSILSRATPSKPTRGRPGNNEDLILTKDGFDSAMRHVISLGRGKANMTLDTQRVLSDLLTWIFNAFDRSDTGKASATEMACGLMVLCAGKKSDKLEYGFELLDSNRDGKLSRRQMSNYLKSFLTVLLSVTSAPCLDSDPTDDSFSYLNGGPCDRESSTIARASYRGSDWATGEAFEAAASKAGDDGKAMSFDSFAEWYTSVGYTSIPWLELLDLRKWVFTSSR